MVGISLSSLPWCTLVGIHLSSLPGVHNGGVYTSLASQVCTTVYIPLSSLSGAQRCIYLSSLPGCAQRCIYTSLASRGVHNGENGPLLASRGVHNGENSLLLASRVCTTVRIVSSCLPGCAQRWVIPPPASRVCTTVSSSLLLPVCTTVCYSSFLLFHVHNGELFLLPTLPWCAQRWVLLPPAPAWVRVNVVNHCPCSHHPFHCWARVAHR